MQDMVELEAGCLTCRYVDLPSLCFVLPLPAPKGYFCGVVLIDSSVVQVLCNIFATLVSLQYFVK